AYGWLEQGEVGIDDHRRGIARHPDRGAPRCADRGQPQLIAPMARAPRRPRIHACNIVAESGGQTRLWSFTGSEGRLAAPLHQPSDLPLPAARVSKGWIQLVRPRFNVVWVAGQPVFLQLIHLPTDDPAEVPSMLELQIEKLSPLPL